MNLPLADDEPVRLETARLVLHAPLDARDGANVAAFQSRNRAHFGPWDPIRPPAYFAPEYWDEQLRCDEEELAEGTRMRFFFTLREEPGRVVGFAHFANIVRGAFWACHLGFGVDQALQGTGVMREGLEASIEWMFETAGLHRIEANHRPENVRSAALLRRLGFIPQGYARDYLRIDGAWRDHVLTALTNERWTPPRP